MKTHSEWAIVSLPYMDRERIGIWLQGRGLYETSAGRYENREVVITLDDPIPGEVKFNAVMFSSILSTGSLLRDFIDTFDGQLTSYSDNAIWYNV